MTSPVITTPPRPPARSSPASCRARAGPFPSRNREGGRLQVEPQLRRGAERLAQAQRSVGGDAGFLLGDALNARARHVHLPGQRAGGQLKRHQEFLAQNFSGVHGWKPLVPHFLFLLSGSP